MKIERNLRMKHITPEVGMVMTDGETYSESVYIPIAADESRWHEVRKEVVTMTEDDVADLVDAWNDADRLRVRLDELGKVVQTLDGNGTMADPYKGVEGRHERGDGQVVLDRGWLSLGGYQDGCAEIDY